MTNATVATENTASGASVGFFVDDLAYRLSKDHLAASGRNIDQNNINLKKKSPDVVTSGLRTWRDASKIQETIVATRVHLPTIRKMAETAAMPKSINVNA